MLCLYRVSKTSLYKKKMETMILDETKKNHEKIQNSDYYKSLWSVSFPCNVCPLKLLTSYL